jgi:hypothetical protein
MLGIDLGIGAGDDFPRIEFGLLCRSRWWWSP